MFASLGLPGQWERRRAEAEEASRRAGFEPVFLDPPLWISRGPTTSRGRRPRGARAAPDLADHGATARGVTLSPRVHHGHETVARGVQQRRGDVAAVHSLVDVGRCGATSPPPTCSIPFGDPDLARMLHILEAYAGEIERNDYRRLLIGRATTNAVLGSERVFGFGSPAASALPYAEVLTEVRRMDGRWMASEAHQLDEGPAARRAFGLDLTAWVESPSAPGCRPHREVHEPDAGR